VGFCLVVPQDAVSAVLAGCAAAGHEAWELGRVEAGEPPVAPGATGDAPALAGMPY